jgi:hypothetical protein
MKFREGDILVLKADAAGHNWPKETRVLVRGILESGNYNVEVFKNDDLTDYDVQKYSGAWGKEGAEKIWEALIDRSAIHEMIGYDS